MLSLAYMNAVAPSSKTSHQELVSFESLGDSIKGLLTLPENRPVPPPVLIISHGAGEFKENYIEMSEALAKRGIASLALDMHGHGDSGGVHYQIDMKEWTADIRAAVDFIETRADLDAKRIGALGLSSGGTAILEAGVQDQRIKALIPLDATIMDTLPVAISVLMKFLSVLGSLKRKLTGKDIRISLVSMLKDLELASDPEINARLRQDPGKLKAFMAFPLPGAKQAFIVDTIKRVHLIKQPTLVIWGAEDKLDPISTGECLYNTLTCEKALEIVAGNGHVGHLDRNRHEVFELAARWLLKHLP